MQEENFRKDAVIISWSKIVHEKLQDKSSEYCLECKDNNGDNHRDDCCRGNNLKFILHHFPIILKDALSICNFWMCSESYMEKNPYEGQLMTCIEDFLCNRGNKTIQYVDRY